MNEPVAYINVEERKLEWAHPIKWETPTVVEMDKVPLYTKREWVNLTVEERETLRNDYEGSVSGLISAVQMMLKEKNNG